MSGGMVCQVMAWSITLRQGWGAFPLSFRRGLLQSASAGANGCVTGTARETGAHPFAAPVCEVHAALPLDEKVRRWEQGRGNGALEGSDVRACAKRCDDLTRGSCAVGHIRRVVVVWLGGQVGAHDLQRLADHRLIFLTNVAQPLAAHGENEIHPVVLCARKNCLQFG